MGLRGLVWGGREGARIDQVRLCRVEEERPAMSRRRDPCHWILKEKSVDMVDSKGGNVVHSGGMVWNN